MKTFIISCAVFFGVCIILGLAGFVVAGKHFSYMLDDTYIHLSVAKNFAESGVWGITKYRFSSTSSSPLFTFLLSAVIFFFGKSVAIPLVLNVVFGILLVYQLDRYFSNYFGNAKAVIGASLVTLFFAVMQLQVLSGMEHVLQSLLLALNIRSFCEAEYFGRKRFRTWFYLSLMLLGLARFEMMFYFAALAFVLAFLKKFKTSAMVLVCGFLPVAVFCWVNYQHSGYLFPNSVVVKGQHFDHSAPLFLQIFTLLKNKFLISVPFYKTALLPLLVLVFFLVNDFRAGKRFASLAKNNFWLLVVVLTIILHGAFATFSGFFRYEAYLMVGFCMAAFPRLKLAEFNFKKDKILLLAAAVFALLFGYKTAYSAKMLLFGPKEIYSQQLQSARFLRTYYNDKKIVANDIGAITYFTEIRLLDFVGLGSAEMIPYSGSDFGADFRRALEQKSADCELALVYDDWLAKQIPQNWHKVAELKIHPEFGRVAVGKTTVSVYSINRRGEQILRKNIKNFDWSGGVTVEMKE